jgi:hypothetical protein
MGTDLEELLGSEHILKEVLAQDKQVQESMYLPILEVLQADSVPNAEGTACKLASKVKVLGLSMIRDARDYCTAVTDGECLRLMARMTNWRGVPTADLIYELQDLKEMEPMVDSPNHRLYCGFVAEAIGAELERRRAMKVSGNQDAAPETIQAMKQTLGGQGLADIIARYTEVFVHKPQWTFRCTLHGQDRNPSGVIYLDEMRWWCFGCNRGGDVFDAVMAFEGVTMAEAIAILGRYLGIDVRAMTPRRKKGGVPIPEGVLQ